jgi:DNA-3-methyladenine glycosylase II
LFDPSLPEKAADYSGGSYSEGCFPTPLQVSQVDIATLKSAGLSTRKAEYVLDLASRFSDGRLSTDKISNANDEELAEMLTAVRGIGVWTVNMFAIFSLRRPDVLPVGDLGVQRGMLRWFLALHSSAHPFTLSPEKISQSGRNLGSKNNMAAAVDVLPTLSTSANIDMGAGTRDASSVQLESLPPTITPSITKTLASERAKETRVALPDGITLELLKGRLQGKKVKSVYLHNQSLKHTKTRLVGVRCSHLRRWKT